MKTSVLSLIVLSLLAITGCTTTHTGGRTKDDSETVMVIYHVQPGKEAEFQTLVAHAWEVYRGEHLVTARPHVLIRDTDGEGQPKFVEIFTWTRAPDHPPKKVMAVWQEEQSLCEARDGHRGIEGGEVALIAGK